MGIWKKIQHKMQMFYFRLFKPWHYQCIKSGEMFAKGLREGFRVNGD